MAHEPNPLNQRLAPTRWQKWSKQFLDQLRKTPIKYDTRAKRFAPGQSRKLMLILVWGKMTIWNVTLKWRICEIKVKRTSNISVRALWERTHSCAFCRQEDNNDTQTRQLRQRPFCANLIQIIFKWKLIRERIVIGIKKEIVVAD